MLDFRPRGPTPNCSLRLQDVHYGLTVRENKPYYLILDP
jgi:hypothetical protein